MELLYVFNHGLLDDKIGIIKWWWLCMYESGIHNHLKQKLNSANFVITNVIDLVANDN